MLRFSVISLFAGAHAPGVDAHGGFLQKRGPNATPTANWLKIIMDTRYQSFTSNIPEQFQDAYPPQWGNDVSQTEDRKRLARDAGAKWNTHVKELLGQGIDTPCQSMRDMKGWYWTRDEIVFDVIGGRASQTAHSLDQDHEVERFWNGQKELNAIWRENACKGLAMSEINDRCSGVLDAREGFTAVCNPGSSSSSCNGCR